MYNTYPFKLKPLPYPYDSLEPHIDEKTVRIHHDKHLKTYVDNLNKALQPYPEYQNLSLEQLILSIDTLPKAIQTQVRNNAGGVYNHTLYFDLMWQNTTVPTGNIAILIRKYFGSFDNFRENFKQSALSQFGSGWAYLVSDKNGNLSIVNTPNQDTPLPKGLNPILIIDVWEHAYYLKYQNRREQYIDNWFYLINWNVVNNLYNSYLQKN